MNFRMASNEEIDILIVETSLLWIGGVQKHIFDLIRSINKNIFAITYCGKSENVFTHILRKQGVDTRIIPFRSYFDIMNILKLIRLIKTKKVKIIHTHTPGGGIVGRIAALLAGRLIIIHTVHGPALIDRYEMADLRFVQKLKLRFLICIERILDKQSDILITVCNADVEKLTNRGNIPKKGFAVIPYGVDIAAVHPTLDSFQTRKSLNIRQSDRLICTVANLNEQKGLNYLIAASEDVARSYKNVKFLVIGDGPLKSKLEYMIDELNLTDKVFLLGHRSDVYNILNTAEIFVLSSLWEGLPISLIEAMALWKPVITTWVNGCKEIIDHGVNGLLVPPKNATLLAIAIKDLLTNKKKALLFGERNVKIIQNRYGLSTMVRSIESLYLKIAKV